MTATAGRAGHIGPEHHWAQAALDRAVARAADPDARLACLLAQKIAAAQAAGKPVPAAPTARAERAVDPAADRPVAGAGDRFGAEPEEPTRWTTDRW